jgi:hypothetical protein
MKLGAIETLLLPAARRAVGQLASVHAGPPVITPATGLKPQVFLHAARYEDLGGVTADGARVARRPLRLPANLEGYAVERPARLVVEATCFGPTHELLGRLCAELTPALLLGLETLPDPVLAVLSNDSVRLQFADFSAVLRSAETHWRREGDAAYYVARLVFHLDGFLHVRLTRRGGLAPRPAVAPRLSIAHDPEGADLPAEHVLLSNDTAEPMPLAGWVLQDAARRPHRYVFPDFTLAPGASVRLWTRQGRDDAENLHWGRRQAVWNNTGDTAVLLDGNGFEVARVGYAPNGARRKKGRPEE